MSLYNILVSPLSRITEIFLHNILMFRVSPVNMGNFTGKKKMVHEYYNQTNSLNLTEHVQHTLFMHTLEKKINFILVYHHNIFSSVKINLWFT